MLRSDFIELPEWQKFVRHIQQLHEEATVGMRNAANFETSRYCVGVLDTLENVLALPELLLSDGEPKQDPQADGVAELPHHPRTATRHLY